MNKNKLAIQRIQEFVEDFNSDDKVIPWMANVCNKMAQNPDHDLDSIIVEHTVNAYWTDLGGEGS